MPDQFDVELVDHALLEELQMTADLMAAANQSTASLSLAEIDRVPGVTETVPGTDRRTPPATPDRRRFVRGQVRVPRPRGSAGGVGQGT